MTEACPCYTGVKQGCMLSPTLFNLYLSDLPEFLNSPSSTDILHDYSERPINTPQQVGILLRENWTICKSRKNKSHDLYINNCGKSLNNYSFKYGGNKLNNVKS